MTKYVQAFRERLCQANTLARQHLADSQRKRKDHYDKTSDKRGFQVGDQVVALLPVSGSDLSAKFDGPYEILEKVRENYYVIGTPNWRRKTRVCHVNMLKLYHSQPAPEPNGVCAPVVTVVTVM